MMKVAFKKKVATLGWSTCQMHTEEGTTGTWLKSPNCLQSSWIATTDLQNTIDQPKTDPLFIQKRHSKPTLIKEICQKLTFYHYNE